MIVSVIKHHLSNLTYINIHLDTLLTSWLIAGTLFFLSRKVIRRFTFNQNISRLQTIYETIIEKSNELVSSTTSREWIFGTSLALTTFSWIFIMNLIGLIPVDFFPVLLSIFAHKDVFRITPTADINTTLALSLTIFTIKWFLNIKNKKLYCMQEILSQPFGIYLFPLNIIFLMLEELSRHISLAIRLFGNIYIGEVVFILITQINLPLQMLTNCAWSILHIFISLLQAFIFALLTIIYLDIAYKKH